MVGYAQCRFYSWAPRVFWTWRCHDGRGCCLQKSTLHSDAHDGYSRRSSLTLSPLCLETPWSPETHRLWPWISICSFIHQGTVQATRYTNILLYSLAPPDGQTNGMCQPGARPVPLSIHQQMTGQLVRPPIHRRVPAQQLCPFCDATTSVPTRHRTNFPHGFWAETEPLQPGDSQWIHQENEVRHRESQVCNLQGAGRHDKVLQSKKVSGSCIQTQGPGIPRRVRYQNDMSISKVVTLQTRTLRNWVPSRTNSLPTQVAPWIETVAPGIQCGQVVCHSRWSDTRKEATSPATTHCYQWRTRVGGKRGIR